MNLKEFAKLILLMFTSMLLALLIGFCMLSIFDLVHTALTKNIKYIDTDHTLWYSIDRTTTWRKQC